MTSLNWARLPVELRERNHWCIASPTKEPFTISGHRASSTDPRTWNSFEAVVDTAEAWESNIGFMLGGDGLVCIDIDIKPDTDPLKVAQAHRMIEVFDSYTEHSASGLGYHIWVRGTVGDGRRREGVEVYDRERFMVCTGNVVRDKPIAERQDWINQLISEMNTAAEKAEAVELVEVEQEVDGDEVVWNRACAATNADKFLELWKGDWVSLGYPSQSEADLSLLSMLCFYTNSNAQVRRMFRASGLGKREKAVKNNKYIDRTLVIIRSRQAKEAASLAQGAAMAEALMAKVRQQQPQHPPVGAEPTFPELKLSDIPVRPHSQGINLGLPNGSKYTTEWPPGCLGYLAQWLYSIAPRPVREVAIVTALGFYAGLCGRGYHISNSGLNLYIVLVARSAIGKEAMHSGISRLVHVIGSVSPFITQCVDFADYASGPALIKSLAERSSFVNVAGEWGRKLRKMSDDHTEGPMASLRTAMTNLYQKSSAGTIVGGIGYSDKEKDVKAVNGVAYSMIGETTPDTFYASLTNTMMADGFLSRFIVIEYDGDRPPMNTNTGAQLDEGYIARIQQLAEKAYEGAMGYGTEVGYTAEAKQMLDDFNLLCDTQINGTVDEAWRQMWNRAHLKALKISGLLAVADNTFTPTVTVEHATWALNTVKRDISIMSRKMHDGDVGDGDMARERKILSVVRSYLTEPVSEGYGVPIEMHRAGIVPRKFIQVRVQRVENFVKHRLGQTAALDAAIRSLIDSGYLQEMPKDKIPAAWGFSGKCYRVLSLPEF